MRWRRDTGSTSRHVCRFAINRQRGAAWRGNLSGLADAIGTNVRALWGDLRDFAGNPAAFRWNRVSGTDGFFTGRHGGVYRIHPPGLSLLLLPGTPSTAICSGVSPGIQASSRRV